jgi:hypothetical protein
LGAPCEAETVGVVTLSTYVPAMLIICSFPSPPAPIAAIAPASGWKALPGGQVGGAWMEKRRFKQVVMPTNRHKYCCTHGLPNICISSEKLARAVIHKCCRTSVMWDGMEVQLAVRVA